MRDIVATPSDHQRRDRRWHQNVPFGLMLLRQVIDESENRGGTCDYTCRPQCDGGVAGESLDNGRGRGGLGGHRWRDSHRRRGCDVHLGACRGRGPEGFDDGAGGGPCDGAGGLVDVFFTEE